MQFVAGVQYILSKYRRVDWGEEGRLVGDAGSSDLTSFLLGFRKEGTEAASAVGRRGRVMGMAESEGCTFGRARGQVGEEAEWPNGSDSQGELEVGGESRRVKTEQIFRQPLQVLSSHLSSSLPCLS